MLMLLLGAIAGTDYFTQSAKSFHIIDLNCDGTENNVFNCSYNTIQQHSCSIYEEAYVHCQGSSIINHIINIMETHSAPNTTDNCTNGEIRLVGGDTEYEGRVEVCYGGVWGSVCPSSWDSNDAKVVCRQLEYTAVG